MENVKHQRKEGVQLFVNKELELEVRAVEIDGEGWLVGKDIAKALGYSRADHAINRHCDEDDVSKQYIIDNLGRSQETLVINESGLYSLVLGSKLPGAKKFRRWVTAEVLPQIRKTGGYIPIDENMDDEEFLARALEVAHRTLKKKEELLKAKEQEIKVISEELDHKNRFINQIAVSENSLLVREVAKIASKSNVVIGEKRLWSKLREWGLIFKNSTEPKQCGVDRGYFEVNEGTKEAKGKVFTYRTTRVTGKGQAYIIERLLKEV